MIALALSAWLAVGSPVLTCTGADIAIEHLRMKLVKADRTFAEDRVLITADVVNVGNHAQPPRLRQHAELLRDGTIVGSQSFPSLAAGVTYPLQFRIFRDPGQRREPLEVLVRYVLDQRHPRQANCSTGNDSLQKLF